MSAAPRESQQDAHGIDLRLEREGQILIPSSDHHNRNCRYPARRRGRAKACSRLGRARDFAILARGRSKSQVRVAWNEVASWQANQTTVSRGSQGDRLEHLFFAPPCRCKSSRNSASWSARYGRTSLASAWHSSPAALSAMPTSSSPASASRTQKSLTPCSARLSVNGFHEGPLPQGGEGMRVSASERWGSLAHKAAGLRGQREETPLQPPAPYSRGTRKCAPHQFSSGGGLGIHQPGSNTRGFAFERQPASGRARDRAMCPAVARNSFHGSGT